MLISLSFSERDFHCYVSFRNYISLEKGVVLHLNKIECPSPKNALCKVWLKVVQGLRINFVNVFSQICIYLPLEKGVSLSMPYIEEYFEPNLVEIGLTVLDEKFLKFRQVFLLFRSNLPLELVEALHLHKLECPLPKDTLCQVRLKVAQWFWRRKF